MPQPPRRTRSRSATRDDADEAAAASAAPAASTASSAVRIVGCGRSLRQDDQAGLRVADLLIADPPRHAFVSTTEAPGGDLAADLEGVGLLIVIDACQASGQLPAGHWRRFDYRGGRGRLAPRCRTDTHSLSVDSALALADELGALPPHVWIYAIAAQAVGYGEALSRPVHSAVADVADAIRADVRAWRAEKEGRSRA